MGSLHKFHAHRCDPIRSGYKFANSDAFVRIVRGVFVEGIRKVEEKHNASREVLLALVAVRKLAYIMISIHVLLRQHILL